MTGFIQSNPGELAALLAAFFWAVSSLIFTRAAHELGAGPLNRLRLVLSSIILGIVVYVWHGWGWAHSLTTLEIIILALSGVIGLAIGDRFFFAALREMGARHSTQVFALSPISATLLAWLALGETLALGVVIGIIIAISGVMIVTSEKKQNKRSSPSTIKGILYATFAALCHSVAFVLAKHIMGDHIDPLDAILVRMVGATVAVWLVAGFQGKALATVRLMSTGRHWVLASSGALLGPSLGAWAALAAVTYAPVGIASTLMSLTPIMVIPLVILLDGEKVSLRAFLGAAVSFVGVTLIFAY